MQKRILIIEDEKAIARFMQLELEHEGYAVKIAADGLHGLQEAETNAFDLLLLDIMLPGISGIEVCRRIRQFSELPIIMVTAKDDVTDKVSGLDMGADDYITKPFAIEELLARIRRSLKRKENSPPEADLRVGDLVMESLIRQVSRAGHPISLTKKEYDLLEYLLINKEIALSREKILEQVWGYACSSDTNIVDVYIRYLRSKIDDPFAQKLIQTIRGVGYAIREQD